MNNKTLSIRKKLKDPAFLNTVMPSLTLWGLKDEDVLVHSMGVSLWNTLGHELNHMAVAECPAPIAAGDSIRSDSAWFNKETRQPCVLIEFERYDGSEGSKQKLLEKLSNLMEAAGRWEVSAHNLFEKPLLILAAWNIDIVSAPNVKSLAQQACSGTTNRLGVPVPSINATNFLFCRFMFESMPDGTIRLNDIIFQEGV